MHEGDGTIDIFVKLINYVCGVGYRYLVLLVLVTVYCYALSPSVLFLSASYSTSFVLLCGLLCKLSHDNM